VLEAYTASLWGVGLSHEIVEIAEAETVPTVEGHMPGAVIARRRHSAGVEGHITHARIALEPRKPCIPHREVAGGRQRRGKPGAADAKAGWRIEV
jgi:hypothetical protein